jgi:hypothetical protein
LPNSVAPRAYLAIMIEPESLLWTKPAWLRREFVLTRGTSELARLAFAGWGSSSATIRTPEGWWTIVREGFWRARVTMQGGGTLLTARATWSGAYDLETSFDGAARWSCFSVWKQHYGWSAAGGAPLIVYRPATAFSQRVQAVDVLAGGELTIPRLLLIVLGGYFLQRTQEDIAASAAAVSA